MMGKKGQGAIVVLIVAVLLLGGAFAGWYFYWQQDPANRTKPPFSDEISDAMGGGDIVTMVKIKTDVTITTSDRDWWEGLIHGETTVSIDRSSIERDTYETTLGLFTSPSSGELVVKVLDEGRLVSDWARNFEVDEGLFPGGEGTFTTDYMKVGQKGSGSYTLKAIIYDDEGKLIDEDSTSITI